MVSVKLKMPYLALLNLTLVMVFVTASNKLENLVSNVNTFIGTSYYKKSDDVHDYGNTAPYAGTH